MRIAGVTGVVVLSAFVALVGCVAPLADSPMLELELVPTRTEDDPVDRRAIVDAFEGVALRVVVVPSDGDPEHRVVAYLQAWNHAGTSHVLPTDIDRVESVPELFQLASVIEIAGAGPHTLLKSPKVQAALREAADQGKLILKGAERDVEVILESSEESSDLPTS